MISPDDIVLVAGGGGFIGGHWVKRLRNAGFTQIRAVDCKPIDEWHQRYDDVENIQLDLQRLDACEDAVRGCRSVYNLAADMGGMGFIENNRALCMLSVLINTHLLLAAKNAGSKEYFYASSACVYAAAKQRDTNNPGLRESDAYPAEPEDGYGWEKLFSERMCRHFYEDFGLDVRVARFHNVYGPYGSFDGGREKAPAAICRKVAAAKLSGDLQIEIWGDGEQTRSFTYIDDCVEGIDRLMKSEVVDPINLGSDEMVSINELVSIVETIAGVKLKRHYKLDAPKGVRGRCSDNTMIQRLLGWAPSTKLYDGLMLTYAWIENEMREGHISR
ncbi:MAG: NAD-dependent epimerase/dehydratase family protein [Verrucomicrobiota bacterium]